MVEEIICTPGASVLLKLETYQFQRVGPVYADILYGLNSDGSDSSLNSKSNSSEDLQDSEIVGFHEVDISYLKSLDPKEWKQQDHYAVLGLEQRRIESTEEDIKRAYKKMVLIHHPDKRKAKGEVVNQDDDYFTCITRAFEILGNPKCRISFDSVDPEFDDNIPTESEIKKDYYKIFNKYFTLNSRWSEKKNVPQFGTDEATREEVDKFYNFWYDFESWREFSYLDEEDKDKGQDREERRWIEKQNKVQRIKRKKEEMSRIRSLVDLAYNNDKRINRFKREEKERKLAAKRAKMDAAQAQKHEEERQQKEQLLAKERADKEEQKRIEQIRYEREQQKRLVKKERKTFRDKAKESNYFAANDKDVVKNMENVEKICEMLSLLELQEFNKELLKGGKNVFFQRVKVIDQKIKEEREGAQAKKPDEPIPVPPKVVDKSAMWETENVQLLIKAVNLFPAGTIQRWEVIASFMNQHSPFAQQRKFLAKEVLNKAKSLQQGDFSKSVLKTAANESAFENFEKSKKIDAKIATDKFETSVNDEAETKNAAKSTTKPKAAEKKVKEKTPPVAESPLQTQSAKNENAENTSAAANQSGGKTASTPTVWSKEEQSLLEQAIKTYPISTADRWDKIAECIPNRTKKDCLRRVKELVELVNSKKEAQQGVKA